jgi:hypothetical protein
MEAYESKFTEADSLDVEFKQKIKDHLKRMIENNIQFIGNAYKGITESEVKAMILEIVSEMK